MIALGLLLALSVSAPTDGSCAHIAEPAIESLADGVRGANAIVYADGPAPSGELDPDEVERRRAALNDGKSVDVPPTGPQTGSGRCAALDLEAVFGYWHGHGNWDDPGLDTLIDYAKQNGWTTEGALSAPAVLSTAQHFGYSAHEINPSFDDLRSITHDQHTPLLIGIDGTGSSDPILGHYPSHMMIVEGVTEENGVKYVVGKDPNLPGDQVWKWDDLQPSLRSVIRVDPPA